MSRRKGWRQEKYRASNVRFAGLASLAKQGYMNLLPLAVCTPPGMGAVVTWVGTYQIEGARTFLRLVQQGGCGKLTIRSRLIVKR